ncbi:MAG: magnesium transporter CorA family protein [Candidatus Heimdallarchaeota archaeon]|nr:magnesium transporter CorA family protein [Candidatus Heimdallarchaeota archaeon]
MVMEVINLYTKETRKSLPDEMDGCYNIIIYEPSKDELLKLEEKLKIPFDELEDALDEDERPRLEETEDYLKIIFRVPKKVSDDDQGSTTQPIVIFLSEKYIVEIFTGPFDYKKAKLAKQASCPQTPLTIFFDLLNQLVRSFEFRLDILDKRIHDAEDDILKTIKPESIWMVFNISKAAIYLEASLKGNLKVYTRLQRVKIFASGETAETMEDLKIDLEQQVELIGIYRELVENSLDAYASAISNNQNDLIKVLSSISLILIFPTLIASLYGMNVALPLDNYPHAFWIILAISAFFTFLLYLFFKKKSWI